MRSQRITAVAAGMLAMGLAVTGCSGGSSNGKALTSDPATPTPHHHHHHKPKPTPTPTPTETVTATPTPTVTVTSSTAVTVPPTTAGAQNLDVTGAVRKQLVQAGADTHQLPASDYTGLVPGETYYAYDPATSTYWAGAGLVPSQSSEDAQISVQDDGSYLVFKRHSSGIWAGYNVGLAGIAGAKCQIKPPASVVAVWHWDKGSCRPPS